MQRSRNKTRREDDAPSPYIMGCTFSCDQTRPLFLIKIAMYGWHLGSVFSEKYSYGPLTGTHVTKRVAQSSRCDETNICHLYQKTQATSHKQILKPALRQKRPPNVITNIRTLYVLHPGFFAKLIQCPCFSSGVTFSTRFALDTVFEVSNIPLVKCY